LEPRKRKFVEIFLGALELESSITSYSRVAGVYCYIKENLVKM